MEISKLMPRELLEDAIKAVPAVRYALGIAGVASVISIVGSLNIDYRVAVFGTPIILILMGTLVIFARLTKLKQNWLTWPAIILTWFCLALTIAVTTCLFLSVFFRFPVDLEHVINPRVDVLQYSDSTKKLDAIEDKYIKADLLYEESKYSAAIALLTEIIKDERFQEWEDKGKAYFKLGEAYRLQSEDELAKTYLEKSLSEFQVQENRLWEGISLLSLSITFYKLGDVQTSNEYFEKSIVLFDIENDIFQKTQALIEGGVIRYLSDELDTSSIYFDKALIEIGRLKHETDTKENIISALNAQVLVMKSEIDLRKREYGTAEKYAKESQILFSNFSMSEESHSLWILGRIYQSKGEYVLSEKMYRDALAKAKFFGDSHYTSQIYNSLGNLSLFNGDVKLASKYFNDSLVISKVEGRDIMKAQSLLGLANSQLLNAEFESSKSYLSDANVVISELDNETLSIEYLISLGKLSYYLGDYEVALSLTEKAKVLVDKTGSGHYSVDLNILKGAVNYSKNSKQDAYISFSEAERIAHEIGDSYLIDLTSGLGALVKDCANLTSGNESGHVLKPIKSFSQFEYGEGKLNFIRAKCLNSLGQNNEANLEEARQIFSQSSAILPKCLVARENNSSIINSKCNLPNSNNKLLIL